MPRLGPDTTNHESGTGRRLNLKSYFHINTSKEHYSFGKKPNYQ
jgi:hypothetical protein